MTKHTIYCPECDSTNVQRRAKQNVNEVSMDELPAEDEKPVGTTTYSAPPPVEEKVAECRDCGYEVEYKVVHFHSTPPSMSARSRLTPMVTCN